MCSSDLIDFIGSIRDMRKDLDVLPFAPVYVKQVSFSVDSEKEAKQEELMIFTNEETNQFIEEMKEALEKKDFPQEKMEELLSRIEVPKIMSVVDSPFPASAYK